MACLRCPSLSRCLRTSASFHKACWRAVVNGPAEDAEPLIAPVRAYGRPLLDDIRPQPYVHIQRIIEPLFLPGRLNCWKANFVDELSDALIDILIDTMTRVPSPYTLIAIEPMGGAIARVPESGTTFQHRSASFSLLILSGWEDAADTDVNVTWTRELFARTEPLCSAGSTSTTSDWRATNGYATRSG